MSQDRRNRQVRDALDQWLREGQIDPVAHSRIGELYPLTRWDWRSLGRWFLTFGAISLAAGLVLFLREHLTFTLPKLAISLSVLTLGLFIVGRWLPGKGLRMLGSSAELLGGFALIGVSFVVGMIYSDGSGNWPALLLIDLLILLVLSYALGNVLLLTLCSVLFFVWFGGRSGYVSGWGAYWFGMNYPLRFLGAAAVLVAAGALHLRCEAGLLARYNGFAKVWISCGLFVGEMSLWLLSLFGSYDLIDGPWQFAEDGELLMFNVLWALVSLGVLTVGLRQRFGMLVGYGSTFLIIQLYTLFFTQLAESLGWLLSLLIAGGSLLFLVIWLESQRQKRRGVISEA
ncbi:DUF2157 domain-containing protein [Pseudomonas sp. ICMP 561]|uniref:DUF2157 domain-containing protein n=1 Tax=Pseudomonas sp. ICMP 561 TaxID=1718918 RepID=UPI000C0690AE|nr:hypothetical protein [Pseudomonas sp. ICMP 561]PHN22800.1 hypothetical protein AO242_16105 [Pseudomonas sp. ICMP 561]